MKRDGQSAVLFQCRSIAAENADRAPAIANVRDGWYTVSRSNGKEGNGMKLILHDLGEEYAKLLAQKADRVIAADGRYAPCQGCFGCWTKHPAECFMKDRLQQACRHLGAADQVVIVTKNLYGGYSAPVKNVLDRSIGTSTPFSTYLGGQMHHTLRYGKKALWKVIVYGDATEAERATFTYTAERNAVNEGCERSEIVFLEDLKGLEAAL